MALSDKQKADLYRWIKIGGILSFLPFILAAGPLAGYFLGDYLEKSLHLPKYISAICIIIGFLTSVREAIRVIRITLREEKSL